LKPYTPENTIVVAKARLRTPTTIPGTNSSPLTGSPLAPASTNDKALSVEARTAPVTSRAGAATDSVQSFLRSTAVSGGSSLACAAGGRTKGRAGGGDDCWPMWRRQHPAVPPGEGAGASRRAHQRRPSESRARGGPPLRPRVACRLERPPVARQLLILLECGNARQTCRRAVGPGGAAGGYGARLRCSCSSWPRASHFSEDRLPHPHTICTSSCRSSFGHDRKQPIDKPARERALPTLLAAS
jgi:hypothetical protein